MNDELPKLGGNGGILRAAPASVAYRVLARKYRPSSFDDLIGQEPMVRTLSNAFALNRIHQAYILTGVRGVGKTTTARILARAFNYQLQGERAHPSVQMPQLGVHCQAIIDSRHVDVIEMDAASHTGIDDVREIIENARYLPVMAPKKIYIIDEVHMLSKQAFNGLLKTLEEPPEHVRFLFATTEIEKVPITVRSRCQRFDLRRIETTVMIKHLADICSKENIAVEQEALAVIARASEGSVRDALSLLDQAIAYSAGPEGVKAGMLRNMLGLADRTHIIDMFEAVMLGNIATALGNLKEQNDAGADPSRVLTELAEFVHLVTRLKLVPDTERDLNVTQEERERGKAFAESLSLPVLTRAWQLLTKGLTELKDSPRPLASADMVLVRLCFAADIPTPEDALRKFKALQVPEVGATPSPVRQTSGPTIARLATSSSIVHDPESRATGYALTSGLKHFNDVIALASANRDILLKTALEQDVRLVRFEQGMIEFSLVPGAAPQIAQTLMRRLQEWTKERWMVVVSTREGAPSLRELAASRQSDKLSVIAKNAVVRCVMEQFPGAKIVAIRGIDDFGFAAPVVPGHIVNPASNEEVGYSDTLNEDDDL